MCIGFLLSKKGQYRNFIEALVAVFYYFLVVFLAV